MPDKEKPAEKLREFVSEVTEHVSAEPKADKIPVSRENAVAAVNFIAGKIEAAAKGGAATAGKPRKIRVRTKKAKKWREAKREYRKNKKTEAEKL